MLAKRHAQSFSFVKTEQFVKQSSLARGENRVNCTQSWLFALNNSRIVDIVLPGESVLSTSGKVGEFCTLPQIQAIDQ